MEYNNRVIEIINSFDDKDTIKFEIFMYLKEYDLKNIDISELLNLTEDAEKSFEIFKATLLIMLYQSNLENFKKNKEPLEDALESYNSIIDSFNKLASELKATNSLEISLLFSYLLYNGYFSATKKHVYKIENRLMISKFYAADVFNGGGVCLNYSDMLTSILTKKGYDAATIINKVENFKNRTFMPNIKRNIEKPKLHTRILNFIARPAINLIGNHACTLIIDKNRPYIYDATNITMFDCVNSRKASNVLGSGSINLNPYLSMMLINNDKNSSALRRLCLYDNYANPYSQKDFIISAVNNYDYYDNNKMIFNDYNEAIMPDIQKILAKVKNGK